MITKNEPMNSSALLKALKDSVAETDFERLCDAGARRVELLWRLNALSHAHEEDLSAPPPVSTREARSASKKIREVADLISGFEKRRFGSYLLAGDDWRRTRALPTDLETYAASLDQLPQRIAKGGGQLRIGAICQLIWYVKQSTGREHDEEVGALISAILRAEWTASALKRWRSRYEKEIERTGPLEVLPLFPFPLRKR